MNHEGQGDQHDRQRDLERGPETGVAPAGAGNGDTEDHEHGAGQDLRSDETGPEVGAFSRPDGITANVAAKPSAVRPARRP